MCDESYCVLDVFNIKYFHKIGTKPIERIYHRTDGPAIECADGYKAWYINGKRYSEEKYWKIIELKAFI